MFVAINLDDVRNRGERLIKLRDSWFSAKAILVTRVCFFKVEYSLKKENASFTEFRKTPNIQYKRSQTLGDKVLRQEGNSPDYLLKFLNFNSVSKDSFSAMSQNR